MLIKIIGVIIVVSSSSYIGFLIADYYRDRPKQLKGLHTSLQMLETEILYLSTPLPNALKTISEKCDKKINLLFKITADILDKQQGYTAGECWETAVNKYYKNSAINNKDKNILLSLAHYLGETDKENQLKKIKFTLSELKKQEEEAEEIRKKNEKIWRYIGVLTGISIVLLIF